MIHTQPKYSILIPTRNGRRYLPYAIESVLQQSYQNFELIVSDNHSSDGTAAYLAGLDDPRLRKLKPESELSMTSHFEYILSHAQGEWVTVIGDDDGVMPFFFDYLDQLGLDEINVSAISFGRALYFWEGCEELYGASVVDYKPSVKKYRSSNNKALFLGLCSIISYFDLPQLYTTGLVCNQFMQSVKNKSGGKILFANAPDAASAAIFAINANYHYRIEQPIFWVGTSPKSNGFSQSSSVLKERSLEFERQNKHSDIPVETELPAALYEETNLTVLLYESILQCPNVSKFWESKLMLNFFIAGLVLKGGKGRTAAIKAYGGKMFWPRILPFLVAIMSVKFLRRWRLPRWRRDKSGRLRSNDRAKFPTIAHASAAVAWPRELR